MGVVLADTYSFRQRLRRSGMCVGHARLIVYLVGDTRG